MNVLLILAFLFSVGCLIGWCIEVVYRRLTPENKTHKWINPGFLTGPYLPLYGFGLCALYLLAGLEMYMQIANGAIRKIVLFVIMSLAMTVIEYVAGLIFIKRMHIQLWDYSKFRFNIDGIICPLFSFFWALLGAVYYFLIHPYILDALAWFSQNIAFSFFIGMFYGIFAVDVCYSLKLTAKITAFAKENEVLVRYEQLKEHIRVMSAEQRRRYRFIFALGEHANLTEDLRSFLDKQRENNKVFEFIRKKYKQYKK